MTNGLLAIDPGLKVLGWALFQNGLLTRCGLSRTDAAVLGQQAVCHRRNLEAERLIPIIGAIVAERMTWRGADGEKDRNPQVLMDLNLIAGHLADEWVSPPEWKGNVPKDKHQPFILRHLDSGELAIVRKLGAKRIVHNAVDAVGIGLYVLGRLEKRGWNSQMQNVATLLPASVLTEPSTSKTLRASRKPGSRSAKAA